MLQAAAILIFLLGLAHSILGERYILVRLFKRDNLPKVLGSTEFTARTLRFAWHVTTITWWGLAAILWHGASDPLSPHFVIRVIGYTSIVCGLLPLLYTRGRHLSWLVFFAIGALCVLASAT